MGSVVRSGDNMTDEYSEFKCSLSYTPQCDGCPGSQRDRICCPLWNTSEEISNALRAMLAHVKNSRLQEGMK